jgi:AraC family transcriptional regulator
MSGLNATATTPRPHTGVRPILSSKGRPWAGFGGGLYATPGGTIDAPAVPHHLISIHVGAPVPGFCRCDGRSQRRLQIRGDIDIVPAGVPGIWEDDEASTILLLRLAPELVHCAAVGLGLNPDTAVIAPQLQRRDQWIERIAWALQEELRSGDPAQRLYAESLGMALATHLLRPGAPAETRTGRGRGLSRHQLQRSLDYIKSNLEQGLGLAELARVAGLSASHFKVMFKRSTGVTVHQYVIQRRVEQAKRLLLQGRLPLSGVAAEAGFSHQSHMARWMRRLLGVLPTAIRRAGEA